MKTLYNILFNINLFITVLTILSLFAVAKNIGTESFKKNDLLLNIGLTLFFAVTSYAAYYLKQHGKQNIALILFGVIWCVILGIIIHAIMKVRWN
ncbi:MAG: hypothetical protein ABI851_14745 [Saprospiraceae bacterium]